MATDLEKLVVQLSADIKGFDKELAKAVGVSNKQFNAVERRARQMNKNLDGIFAKSFRGLTGPLAGIGAALGVNELRKMTDTWTDMNSRVALAAGGLDKGSEVMGRLGEMARRTYSDLEQTAEGYLLNATALKELGYSTDQSLDYTESLNNALVISGAKGQRAATVTDALAKAMALGKLSGDNLNTVISTGGRVAEALAAGLNTTVGGLRKLGAQGKITGNDLVKALSSQMEVLRKEAADMPATIGDGFTLLNNALLQYVGNADHATGISAKISEALVIIADNFDKTADAALQVAGVLAGGLLGRSVINMVKTLGLGAIALKSFTQALLTARTMGGLATAFGGLSAAAGPVGMIIGGAVVGSLILFSNTSAEASEGARRFKDRLNDIEGAAKSSADEVEAAGNRYNAAMQNSLTNEVDAAKAELDSARESAVNLLAAFAQVQAMSLITPEQYAELARLRDGINDGSIAADEAKQSLFRMANEDYNFQEVADQLGPILDRLALVAQGARNAAAELAAVSGLGEGSSSFSRGGNARARQARLEQDRADAEYVSNAKQRATLAKTQFDLENKIAQVRAQAEKDGRKLTDAQIKDIAEAQLAGDASRSAEGKKPKKEKKERDNDYERLTKSITDRTASMVAETEVQRQLNPLIDDYGYAVEKARAEQELLNAAQKAGVEVTPALRAEIGATAEQFAIATVEAGKLAEAQDKIRQNAEEMADFQKDLTRGIVDGFIQGKKAADIFADALTKIGNKLLDMAFNSFSIPNLFSIGSGASYFPPIPKFAKGTPSHQSPGIVRGPGTGTSDSILARISNKEFIVNAAATSKHRGLLEAINENRLPEFAKGTPPRMSTLRAPSAQSSGSEQGKVDININVSGARGNQEINDMVAKGVKQGMTEYDREVLPRRFRQIAQDPYAVG